MESSIQFIQTTPQELSQIISDAIKDQLKSLEDELLKKNANDQLLTRKETCEFLQINPTTLWHWTNKKKVKAYGIAGRVYYKRFELLASLKLLNK